MKHSGIGVVVVGACAVASWHCSSARAHSFNVEFGEDAGTPSASYAAAAGQAGLWHTIPSFNEGEPFQLIDITGSVRAATISASLPFGSATFDHPGTTGDDGALLDDYLDLRSVPSSIDIIDLAAGDYEVYVYAWAPDDERFGTFVTIQGQEQGLIGGAWTGGLVEGVTHGRALVSLGAGEALTINLFGLTKGTLNGLQIVQVPGVGGLPLLGAAAVGMARRRRAGRVG